MPSARTVVPGVLLVSVARALRPAVLMAQLVQAQRGDEPRLLVLAAAAGHVEAVRELRGTGRPARAAAARAAERSGHASIAALLLPEL